MIIQVIKKEEIDAIVKRKCTSCYKNAWCMLSPYQRAFDCLGGFKDVDDNLKKFSEFCELERKQKFKSCRLYWICK